MDKRAKSVCGSNELSGSSEMLNSSVAISTAESKPLRIGGDERLGSEEFGESSTANSVPMIPAASGTSELVSSTAARASVQPKAVRIGGADSLGFEGFGESSIANSVLANYESSGLTCVSGSAASSGFQKGKRKGMRKKHFRKRDFTLSEEGSHVTPSEEGSHEHEVFGSDDESSLFGGYYKLLFAEEEHLSEKEKQDHFVKEKILTTPIPPITNTFDRPSCLVEYGRPVLGGVPVKYRQFSWDRFDHLESQESHDLW
ncbi:uncharacterized protein LOC133717911 isoform X3 [Rosa rugosa]|uniref:uncharacterized protein LOC133717911 isoform X3 n=1 Tax=Rosa rugosa TaxID=74645 RepID=UPI002B405060|nr:uncharacterized protein LOC133717911 isoform X3 [Rosa rugosa]